MKTLPQIFNSIKEVILTDSFQKNFATINQPAISVTIAQALHEAKWAIEFLQQYDVQDKRVLEIGAGAGIVSACLALYGAHVTMVEPSTGVFDYHHAMCAELFKALNLKANLIATPIEDMSTQQQYDLIFSINVLEHLSNVDTAFSVMSTSLANDGIMFHMCPNYLVPYEPHVGVLLVPFFPKLSFIVSKKLKSHPVSNMLTFITVPHIKKLAKKYGLTVRFFPDVMYQSFMRLVTDREFKKRQSGLPLYAFRVLQSLHLLKITKYVPVCLQTPVAFEMKKK
jgi:2-polyprenyl-3-methyl-5-hydroxy-6-metoxy-1,4-benzoquinol methylase